MRCPVLSFRPKRCPVLTSAMLPLGNPYKHQYEQVATPRCTLPATRCPVLTWSMPLPGEYKYFSTTVFDHVHDLVLRVNETSPGALQLPYAHASRSNRIAISTPIDIDVRWKVIARCMPYAWT
eukprot:692140-Rhodomonas_salina.2